MTEENPDPAEDAPSERDGDPPERTDGDVLDEPTAVEGGDVSRGGEVEPEVEPRARPEAESEDRDGKTEAELEREILGPEERVGPGEAFCHACGEVVDENAELCPECGVRQTDPGAAGSRTAGEATTSTGATTTPGSSGSGMTDPGLAAVVSLFVPGVGNMLLGQTERGALILGGTVLAYVGLTAIGFLLYLFLTAITLGFGVVVFWVFLFLPALALLAHPLAAYDAYDQAQKIERGEVVPN